MKHQEFQELIPFYIAQSLGSEKSRVFEQHLSTCESCRAEIDDWRMIASAVWREADDAARNMPPLSQEVYNRLAYRDKGVTSQFAANPPRPKAPTVANPIHAQDRPKRRNFNFPVTMAAGLIVALVFGGLLFLYAFRPQEEELVALNLTQDANSTSIAAMDAVDISPTPTDLGIIPTQGDTLTPSVTAGENQFRTITPETTRTQVVPTRTELPPNPQPTDTSSQSILVNPPATSYVPPTATNSPEPPAPLGGGPYVTITPGVFSEGYAYCEIFNPTSIGIEIYAQANFNSEVMGVLLPSESLRTLVISIEGWHFVVKQTGERGWISPAFAYLRGSCYPNDLLLATATISANTTPSYEASSGTVAVINAAYADVQAEASFSSASIAVASRSEQFPILGYQGTGNNRFVNIMLPDGRTGWLWSEIVIVYAANEVPPTITPQP